MTFIKTQIEKLRITTKEESWLYDTHEIEPAVLNKLCEPVYEVAYNLLQSIYDVGNVDTERLVYREFVLYLRGDRYRDIDDFMKWVDRNIKGTRR